MSLCLEFGSPFPWTLRISLVLVSVVKNGQTKRGFSFCFSKLKQHCSKFLSGFDVSECLPLPLPSLPHIGYNMYIYDRVSLFHVYAYSCCMLTSKGHWLYGSVDGTLAHKVAGDHQKLAPLRMLVAHLKKKSVESIDESFFKGKPLMTQHFKELPRPYLL